jgi:PAS domain S-box-containing protein
MRESEARFRQLAESIASVFYLISRDGSVLYVSPAYDTVWERTCQSRHEAPGSFADSVHPDDRDHVLANYDRMFQQPIDIEYRLVMGDGRVKWIHDVACPVRDEAGTVVRAAGSATDITHSASWRAISRRRRNWKASAAWPVASRTTSTIC